MIVGGMNCSASAIDDAIAPIALAAPIEWPIMDFTETVRGIELS